MKACLPPLILRVAAILAAVLAPLPAADRAPGPAPAAAAESAPVVAPVASQKAPPAAVKANPTSLPPAAEKADEKKKSGTKMEAEAAAKPPPALPLSPRFLVVRERINLLYGNRDAPPPPIDARHNPFRSQPIAVAPTPAPGSGGAPVAPGAPAAPPGTPPTEPAPPPVNPGIALVKQAAALLRVTGFVERDGRTLLNINQALYREGETVKVAVKGQTVLLRIKKLSRTSLTVTLGEAEHTINF
ncbi:MAG: hypothetical protein HZA93_22170 [Verrucomicrobia bacterium]|nr:hypothetical protein [Verrucomicrobiota bacterium]